MIEKANLDNKYQLCKKNNARQGKRTERTDGKKRILMSLKSGIEVTEHAI